jgi:hypothetical protein
MGVLCRETWQHLARHLTGGVGASAEPGRRGWMGAGDRIQPIGRKSLDGHPAAEAATYESETTQRLAPTRLRLMRSARVPVDSPEPSLPVGGNEPSLRTDVSRETSVRFTPSNNLAPVDAKAAQEEMHWIFSSAC